MTSQRRGRRIYLSELAEIIDRRVNTVRIWESEGKLPRKLLPRRDSRGWRWWTETQVEGIIRWMDNNRRYPGSGLRNWTPTEEQIAAMLQRVRAPRKTANKT